MAQRENLFFPPSAYYLVLYDFRVTLGTFHFTIFSLSQRTHPGEIFTLLCRASPQKHDGNHVMGALAGGPTQAFP